jgi:riboflavin kinase/FMN adenylyltransferase
LEVHIFDFNEDIYGEEATITFFHRIRDERRFPNSAVLVRQIQKDIAEARSLLSRSE